MPSEIYDTYSSQSRYLRMTMPALSGEMHVVRAHIREGVNRLFCAETELISFTDVNPEKVIGSSAEIAFSFPICDPYGQAGSETLVRYVRGIVTEVTFLSPSGQQPCHCKIVIQPFLWRLTQSSDHRIWQQMSAVDVVEALLKEHDLDVPDFRLQAQPPAIEYSVQYGETDYDYMIRRLEVAGLFWWYNHEKDRSRLCIGDQATSWMKAQQWEDGRAEFLLNNAQDGREHIWSWQESFRYVPSARLGADWNFERPNAVVASQVPSLVQKADSGGKGLFSFPDGALREEESEQRQRQKVLADEAQYRVTAGLSNTHLLAPGRVFTPVFVDGKKLPDHVVIGINHHIDAPSPSSGLSGIGYHNSFSAIPALTPLIPHCSGNFPKIETTQIAFVAGPENEQIHCDKYGRVKLWFPWDRKAKKDGSDTCWIRIAQIWAGSGWGAQIIPRVGTEVVVSFLNGDPDQPVVTGVVANPASMPAYVLPDRKSRMTIRSQSYKGDGFNEISLEDTAGNERFFIAAQKEKTEINGGCLAHRIARHSITTVGGNQSSRIEGYAKKEISGSVHEAVGADTTSMLDRLSVLNMRTVELLEQGAGLAGGEISEGLKELAKSLRSQKMGFWTYDGVQKNKEFITDDGQNAGDVLAKLGVELGEDIEGSFDGEGKYHTLIGRLRSATIGKACVEQVAGGRVLNVAGVNLDHTAKNKITTVGEKLSILSGEATDMQSKKIELFADDSVRISTPGGYIELNKSGIVIHGLKIEIQGNSVDFQRGGGGKGVTKPLPQS